MSAVLSMKLPPHVYLRDPEETELGRRMVRESIHLLDQMGFASFTFRKLAAAIDSTEASVYRYFVNKHQLLDYLRSWYWTWLDYRVEYHIHNLRDPAEKLRVLIRVVAKRCTGEGFTAYLDVDALSRILIREAPETNTFRAEAQEQPYSLCLHYQHLCERTANLLREINHNYPYPYALACTLLAVVHSPALVIRYTAAHLQEPAQAADPLVFFIEQVVVAAIYGKTSNT